MLCILPFPIVCLALRCLPALQVTAGCWKHTTTAPTVLSALFHICFHRYVLCILRFPRRLQVCARARGWAFTWYWCGYRRTEERTVCFVGVSPWKVPYSNSILWVGCASEDVTLFHSLLGGKLKVGGIQWLQLTKNSFANSLSRQFYVRLRIV